MRRRTTRRTFLARTSAAALGVLGGLRRAPAAISLSLDKVRIAGVGVGGKGWSDIENVSKGQRVVALCDVDARQLARGRRRYPEAELYRDWRRLLDRKDIHALTISTPDHMHAPIALAAVALGKHVYVQKPLTHNVGEARRLRLAAKRAGVVTQMGNQGHSARTYKRAVAVVRSGILGRIKEAHAWTNRPIWPQGMAARPERADPVPEWLAWDLWLGVAPPRPYVKDVYHPFRWRGWLDFGTGALGDMGCHIFDPVVWALELGPPVSVRSEGPPPTPESYPRWSIIRYRFRPTAHTEQKGLFPFTWYDGGRKPAVEHLGRAARTHKIPPNGSLFIGEKATLLCHHGRGGLQVFTPDGELVADSELPDAEDADHYMQWTNAILGKDRTTSHFEYAGPLTETVLLGNIALHFPMETLYWDFETLSFERNAKATSLVERHYRETFILKV